MAMYSSARPSQKPASTAVYLLMVLQKEMQAQRVGISTTNTSAEVTSV